MQKPNYQFEKRQREQAKKRKKAEKAARKDEPTGQVESAEAAPLDAPAPEVK